LDLIQVTGNVDITWLSKEPMNGTVSPDGGEVDISIGFDSVGLEVGDYYAALAVSSPLAPQIVIPVTMHILSETAPVVNGIPDQTISEGEIFMVINLDDYVTDLDHSDDQLTWSYTGNDQLVVDIVDQVATIAVPDPEWNGFEAITFRATDPDLMWDEDTATFTVTAVNDSPVLETIGDKIIDELTLLTFTATATDPDIPVNNLSFSLIGEPDGALINGTTGIFSWIPTEEQGPGNYTVTIMVCDDGAPTLCDSEEIQIMVNEVSSQENFMNFIALFVH
jgi:hypothetical protein